MAKGPILPKFGVSSESNSFVPDFGKSSLIKGIMVSTRGSFLFLVYFSDFGEFG